MGKKVGLISYHFLYNYGTMLQAYALQRKISDLGYEAEYIDYQFKELTQSVSKRLWSRVLRLGIYLLHFKYYMNKYFFSSKMNIRKKYYDSFHAKYIRTSLVQYQTLQELESKPPEYDIYIVGSDQVWNPNLSCASPAFFLKFVSEHEKKASYAPSLGVTSVTSSQKQKIAEYIKHFRYLSCREKTGANLLESIGSRRVLHVLDPTFLLETTKWEEIAVAPEIPESYILCYFLGDKKHPRDFVQQLEFKTGIKAYYIPCSPIDMPQKTVIYNVGPSEFLGLIQNAAYVCTDSFHGSVFSIIFKRQFYSFCKRKDDDLTSDNSRIKELLKCFGLENRLVNNEQRISEKETQIDYKIVGQYLNPMKERSEAYLNEILNSVGNEAYGV